MYERASGAEHPSTGLPSKNVIKKSSRLVFSFNPVQSVISN